MEYSKSIPFMDSTTIIHFLSESAYLLVVFGIFLIFAISKGRQMLINIICGLYFALLITIHFPYYEKLVSEITQSGVVAAVKLIIFAIIAFLATYLFKRLMPSEYQEGKFESFHKKIALSLAATILVMSFSFNVLPVTEFLTPGTPIQSLFAPQHLFFWWLIAPLAVMYWN